MTNNKLTDEQLENISEMAADAAKRYGPDWDSALVGSPTGNFHAVTSDTIQAVVVQTNDDSRDSSWLCDYLESLSPAQVLSLVCELQEYRKAKPIGEVVRIGPALIADFPGSVMPGDKLYTTPRPLTDAEREELQEYRKAVTPLTDPERQELIKLQNEDALRRQQLAQGMQHDPTFDGILPKL